MLLLFSKRKTNAEASVLPNIISAITHRLCPLGSLVRPPTNLENSNDFCGQIQNKQYDGNFKKNIKLSDNQKLSQNAKKQ